MASTTTTTATGGGGGTASSRQASKSLKITSPVLIGEIQKLFSTLSCGKSTLPVSSFRTFLSATQKTLVCDDVFGNVSGGGGGGGDGGGGSNNTDVVPGNIGKKGKRASWISKVFHPSSSSSQQQQQQQQQQPTSARELLSDDSDLSFDEFVSYLSTPTNSALALPDPKTKDWSRPLNEYFISSSHNTYLVGHQLYGDSTTEGYINVLRRGCRCIEIDVWDGDNGEPEVFHGYTLTKEISFKDVCKAVRKYAFSEDAGEGGWEGGAGEGPIIISLECHAGIEQQGKMVKIMHEQWGDMLVHGVLPEEVMKLPSPRDLRRRILVKAKYTPPTDNTPAPRQLTRAITITSSSSDSELEALSVAAHKKRPKKTKVTRNLASLGVYCSSHHFPGSTHPEPFTKHPTSLIPNHVYSFSEKVFSNLHQQHAEAIFQHNKSYLMRVYPFGLRFTSSNADPTIFWRRGVQLVALNWQKCDEGMMLNEGMFAGEGGYVLKPPSHRAGSLPENAVVTKKLDLAITVIAAAGIPLPDKSDKPKHFEPYVKIEVHAEGKVKEQVKKKTKAKRGVECVWDEKLEFKGVAVLDKLTFVRFKIHDEEFGRDDLAAWACIRLDRLQEGYRFVKLLDNRGEPANGAVVFVKIEKNIY